jgi:hypothetical protein
VNGTSVGDCSPEARARGGSTELNLMNFEWLGERYALLDLPGGTGFAPMAPGRLLWQTLPYWWSIRPIGAGGGGGGLGGGGGGGGGRTGVRGRGGGGGK